MKNINQEEYEEKFKDVKEKALEKALDIRKFEIELYWKRATYFWTLIGATLAGYAAVQVSQSVSNRQELSVILSCLGFLFSTAWHCVNRGSKQWQENWENHVDLLEDSVIGPLYKTVLGRRSPKTSFEAFKNIMTGPSSFSVSGINHIISIYVFFLWLVILIKSIGPISLASPINWLYSILVLATALACIAFWTLARTHAGDHEHVAKLRNSKIN
jgi:hypothetical protein